MTKEVMISIKGLQLNEEQGADNLETIIAGTYYKKNDSHYVVFDEVLEGYENTIKSIIKFNGKEMSLTRHGLVNVHMLFEEKRKNMTSYGTPFGNIMIGIEADNIDLEERENELKLQVAYDLEVNYEHLADCKIEMHITEKREPLKLV
ncbi:MAG: DUF1934 domain-containing protein [Lachnospiraceae bacterium]|nr:DUF1934 domain-containing protein [Lachnospiraceae bacterium]